MIARFTGAEPGANARALILKLQQALEQAEENAKQLGTLSVKVVQLMEDAEPTAQVQYTEDEIIIHLGIPAGKTGDKGAQGNSGVYVGSGEMPEGYNVQIDPDGEVEPFPAALVLSALPEASEALRGSFAIAPEGNNDKLYICMKLGGVLGWVAFNTNGTGGGTDSTTSILGQAVLGTMILGG